MTGEKRNSGFTLVELLVVVVILGIITMMSIPLIRNIQSSNKNRKLQTYERSLVDSAKLYTDSYSSDMFGNSNYGCIEVPYNDLKKKTLIKDIQVSDTTCEGNKTYVRIIKLNDKYTYETVLTCLNKKNNAQIFNSNKISDKTMVCNGGAMTKGPTIEFKPTLAPEVKASNSTKNKNVKIVVNSSYGISPDSSFYYAWSKNDKGTDLTTSSWKRQKLGNTNLDKIGYSKPFDFNTNKLATGDYYLFVRTTDNNGELTLKDGAGNANEQTMYHAGPYVVDKTAPNISTVGVVSTGAWNSVNVKVKLNSTKDNVNQSNLKVCLKQGNAKCLDKDFVSADKAKLTLTGVSYNGTKVPINVYVRDLAGNEAKQVVNYTLYKECETANLVKTTLKSNGACSQKCGGGIRTDVYNTKDKNSGNACSGKTISVPNVACNTMGCCTKTTLSCGSFGSWSSCTKACGTGTQKRTRTCRNVSAYDGSYCSANTTASNTTQTQNCNTQGCCTSTKKVYTANWTGWSSCTKTCGTGTQSRTRTYKMVSNYDGRQCSTGTDKSTQNCNTHPCKPNTPTISNPSNGNWTKNNISLTVSTSTAASNIGWWYYSYDNSNFTRYDNSSYYSYGKQTFVTSPYSAERNQATYIRVCNKSASGPNDTTNCSNSASTMIRIDKTAPTITVTPKYESFAGHPRYLGFTYTDYGSGCYERYIENNSKRFTDANFFGPSVANDHLATVNYYMWYSVTICDLVRNCNSRSGEARW